MLNNNKIDILKLNLQELQNHFLELNLKKFNANQVFDWLHNKLIFDFDKFSNISKIDREKLKNNFYVPRLDIKDHLISNDGDTEKFLFELRDKQLIESVLIGHKNRYTLCVSSQIGCIVGCDFCATGTMKFERNLSVSEIILQFYKIQLYLKSKNAKLENVVYMGMGEPFLNFDNVMNSINMLNHINGQNFSKRNFTISTSGIIPEIEKFTERENQVNLAISLHASTDEARSQIMPINRRWNLESLKNALLQYQKKTKNRITFEYILIDELNCSKNDAYSLISFLRSFNCLVNLIPYNKVIGKPYVTPSKEKQRNFYNILNEKGINVTLRETKGQDIAAACGQLKVKKEKENEQKTK